MISRLFASVYRSSGAGGVICADGDSITFGFGVEQSWFVRACSKISGRFTAFNEAFNGKTADEGNTYRAAFGNVDAHIVPGARIRFGSTAGNLLFDFLGTNDNFAGADAATIIGRKSTYLSDSLSAGWERIILMSMLRRTGGSFDEDVRLAVNEWQAAQANGTSIFYCNFCDIAGLDDPTPGTYYQDTAHPTDVGAELIAVEAAATAEAALAA